MNFIRLRLRQPEILLLARACPERWDKSCHNELSSAISMLTSSSLETAQRKVTELSRAICSGFVEAHVEPDVQTSPLLQAMLSADDRSMRIAIPYDFRTLETYQITIEPGVGVPEYDVQIVRTDPGKWAWFAGLVSNLAWRMPDQDVRVDIAGVRDLVGMRLKWLNALLAMQRATGASGLDNVLLDMAQDDYIGK
jgi:hypothetical protein